MLESRPVSDYTKPSDLINGDQSGGYTLLKSYPLTGVPSAQFLGEKNA